MPQSSGIKFKVYRRRGGQGTMKWFGRIEVPLGMQERVLSQRGGRGRARPTASRVRRHGKGAVTLPVTAPGKDQGSALANAAKLTEKLLESDVAKALAPPGTEKALQAAKLAKKYGPKILKGITSLF